MSIQSKLILTLVPLFLLSALLSYVVVEDLENNSLDLLGALEVEASFAEVLPLTMSQLDATKTLLLDPDLIGDIAEKRLEDYERTLEVLTNLQQSVASEGVRGMISRLLEYNQNVIDAENTHMMEMVFDDLDVAKAYYFKDYLPKEVVFRNLIRDIDRRIGEDVSQKSVGMSEKNRWTLFKTLGILALVILCSGTYLISLSVFISKRLTKDLAQLNQSTQDLQGASVELLQHSESSLGETQENLSEIQKSSEILSDCKSQLADVKNQAARSEEMTHEIRDHLQEGEEIASSLGGAVQDLRKSEGYLENLNKIFRMIDDYTKELDQLVFNTKILAFNAAIEAELAGEHGSGFSIVANEVGKLARESGDVASKIQDSVRENAEQVQDIVSGMRAKIENVESSSVKSTQVFEGIRQLSMDNMKVSEEISGSTSKQQEYLDSIEQVFGRIQSSGQTIAHKAAGQGKISSMIAKNVGHFQGIRGSLSEIING